MRVADLITALTRRWYVTALALLLTAFGVFGALEHIGPRYESTASVLLVPGSTTTPEAGNPFLYLSGLTQARDVLIVSLTSSDQLARVSRAHPDTTVTIAPDLNSSGPILTLTVDSGSAEGSMTVLSDVMHLVPRELIALQQRVHTPAKARITPLTVASGKKPSVLQKTRLRAVVAVAAAGIVGTIVLAGLVDGLLNSRQTRRLVKHSSGSDANTSPDVASGERTSGEVLAPLRRLGNS